MTASTRRERDHGVLLAALLCAGWIALGVECETSRGDGSPPPATVELRNPGFEEVADDDGDLQGWGQQGGAYGRARRVQRRGASGSHALEMAPSEKGSTGTESFMVFQTQDLEAYRGKTVAFGARVATDGAAINVVLWSPEGSANSFDADVHQPSWRERSGLLEVPRNASVLNFAVQVLGPKGGRAWVDDAFVRLAPAGETLGEAADAQPTAAAMEEAEAHVRILTGQTTRTLPADFFGMHLEWVDDANGITEKDSGELRAPVVELLRRLRIPLFRFPGGIHADFYDWRKGIGPPKHRGRTRNPFNKKLETHHFGSPEFLQLLRQTGAQACITANYGTGTAEQAGAWAAWFAQQGMTPRYWEVGNEIYLSGPNATTPNSKEIYKPGDQYARDFPAFKRAIQEAIPNARVGAILHFDTGAYRFADPQNLDWSTLMLDALKTPVDFFALHNAYAPVILDDRFDLNRVEHRDAVYRSYFAAALQTRDNLETAAREVAARSPINRAAPFAITEFGTLLGLSAKADLSAAYVDQTRTQVSAVYIASVLDVFMKNPRVILTAYTNPIHRWYGNLITDTEEGLITTPTFHLYDFYAHRFEHQLVKTEVESPTFDAPQVGVVKARSGIPTLIAQAGVSPDGRRLTALLVNRNLEKMLPAVLEVAGFSPAHVDCKILSAPHPNAINGPRLTATVGTGVEIQAREFPCGSGNTLRLELPPSSILSLVALEPI